MAGTGTVTIKVVMHGSMGGGQTWSTGVFFATPGETTPASAADLAFMAAAISTACGNFWSPLNVDEAPYWTYQGVRLYSYASGGVRATATAEQDLSTPIVGTSSLSNIPYVAAVASLRSNVSSRSTRGRMYLPVTGANTLDASGQFTSAFATTLATSMVTLLHAIQTDINSYLTSAAAVPVVASFTHGLVSTITSVVVDTKADTQHRREDKVGANSTITRAV